MGSHPTSKPPAAAQTSTTVMILTTFRQHLVLGTFSSFSETENLRRKQQKDKLKKRKNIEYKMNTKREEEKKSFIGFHVFHYDRRHPFILLLFLRKYICLIYSKHSYTTSTEYCVLKYC